MNAALANLKYGIVLEGLRRPADLVRLAARVEALGFASLWMADHLSYSQPVADTFQVLSIWAAATERILLGSCVYVVPLRHPALVAKQTASFDWLCGGRFVLGIGVGGEFPAEYAACEVPIGERGVRCNEAIPVLRALWRGEPPPQGRFFHVPATKIAPLPLQAGGPPIWIGGRAEAALRRAAWLGDGYAGMFLDAAGVRKRAERIRELRASAPDPARRDAPFTMATQVFVRVDDDRQRALDRIGARLGSMYGAATSRAAGRFAMAGTIDDCRRHAAELAAAGTEHFIFSLVAGEDEVEEQLERLARLVAR